MNPMEKAYGLLNDWKKGSYLFGMGVLEQLPQQVAKYGSRVMVVANKTYSGSARELVKALQEQGITTVGGIVPGARPNAPREDVYRLETYLLHYQPDCVIAIGGGSTLDACKAAIALMTYGAEVTPEIGHYFGAGLVSEAAKETGKKMIPLIAVATAASSGSHLTKYANVTDPVAGQKMLIVDPAIVPELAVFDYEMTKTMPLRVSIDGALDAVAHTFEVFCGAKPETYQLTCTLAQTALELVLTYTPRLLTDLHDAQAREALGLATDLGGYAIMVGGTSGAHLTSFSLVDLVAHGTACGIMNPYYAVFYAPAIQPQLEAIGQTLRKASFLEKDVSSLTGRERAMAVAEGMIAFGKRIGAPTTLGELPGFTQAHVERILTAAKDPQLSMKLKNMPVPMTAEDVDLYMAPVIRAAVSGDMSGIVNKV